MIVEIDDLVLQPLASSESVLTDAEREMGVILVDCGGGTTDVAVFIDGSIPSGASLFKASRTSWGRKLRRGRLAAQTDPFPRAVHGRITIWRGWQRPMPMVQGLSLARAERCV